MVPGAGTKVHYVGKSAAGREAQRLRDRDLVIGTETSVIREECEARSLYRSFLVLILNVVWARVAGSEQNHLAAI